MAREMMYADITGNQKTLPGRVAEFQRSRIHQWRVPRLQLQHCKCQLPRPHSAGQALERLDKYFNLNTNYTYSLIIDNGNFTTFINLPQNQFDNRSERDNSNQDVRHVPPSPNANFGTPRTMLNPRQLQFSVKFSF